MDESEGDIELTEEVVLQLGNHILASLGAEEPVQDLSPFTDDVLYIELFKGLFEQLPLESMEPGSTLEEKAENLRQLRDILGQTVVDTDLSYISATAILNGDLNHLGEFLQILIQIISALADEGEGDLDNGRDTVNSDNDNNLVNDDDSKTDTQKLKAGLGLDSPDDDRVNEINDFENLDDPMIDDEDLKNDVEPDQLSSPGMIDENSPQFDKSSPLEDNQQDGGANDNQIDVLHDPLLDEGDIRSSSNKKRPRAGSFGDNDNIGGLGTDEDDDEEGIDFDQLDPEQKMLTMQHGLVHKGHQKPRKPSRSTVRINGGEVQSTYRLQNYKQDQLRRRQVKYDSKIKTEQEMKLEAKPVLIKINDEKTISSKDDNQLDGQENNIHRVIKDNAGGNKNNYGKPISSAKRMFKIPTPRYLRKLTNKQFPNYDQIYSCLIKHPNTAASQNTEGIEIKEKVIKGQYQ